MRWAVEIGAEFKGAVSSVAFKGMINVVGFGDKDNSVVFGYWANRCLPVEYTYKKTASPDSPGKAVERKNRTLTLLLCNE